MKKIFSIGCIAIIILILGVGFFVWRMVSGTVQAKDLGIHVTQQQARAAQDKSGVTVIALPADTAIVQSIRFEGTKSISYTMDSAEITALALSHSAYKYLPFKNIQIRINPDGSVEVSSVVDTMKALQYVTAIGFAPADLEKVMNDYHIPRTTVAVYAKGTGSVTNGKVTIHFDAGNVAGIPVPINLVNDKIPEISGILEDGMRRTPGFEAKSITFSDNKVHFDGNVPEKEYIVQ